jgi:uncharacterized RDD family membrane protein YckC
VYILVLTMATLLARALGGGLGLGEAARAFFMNPYLADLFAFLVLVLPVVLYFALSECSARRATLGKRRLRLQVVTVSGGQLGVWQSLLRSGIKFLPWQIAHTSLFHIPGWPLAVDQIPPASIAGFGLVWLLVIVYLGMLIFTRSHRAPYDYAAGSMVIRGD